MKILVAEDDRAQQRLLCHLLETWGFEPLVVGDGLAAIERLRSPDLAIALVDWELPGASGIEVCGSIQRSGRYIHAIVLTARSTAGSAPLALHAGASDYLGKPFSRFELRARIEVARRMVELHSDIARMQKLESIGQLSAGIAHEINTPAQFVSDNLRFASDSIGELTLALPPLLESLAALERSGHAPDLAQKARAAVEAADLDFLLEELPASLAQSLDGIGRIAEIVRAMKTFAHPGSSGLREVDVNEALHSTVIVSRAEWKEVAELELELDPDLPHIACHPAELNQALLNVLVNAAHAVAQAHGSDPSRGRIRISTRTIDDAVLVTIGDNGVGIPPEIQERVFDPFFTTKEVGKGTGQGLALAHDVVTNLHQGLIWFQTEPGKGTSFCIQLPLEERDT